MGRGWQAGKPPSIPQMGSLSFAEILTIAVVILIIFGPNRLPEFARKLGELMAKARQATQQFSDDISGEFSDSTEPLRGVKADFEGIKHDIKKVGSAFVAPDEMPSVDKKLPAPGSPNGDETGEIEIVDRDEPTS